MMFPEFYQELMDLRAKVVELGGTVEMYRSVVHDGDGLEFTTKRGHKVKVKVRMGTRKAPGHRTRKPKEE